MTLGFGIGDRVRCTSEADGNESTMNATGVIVQVNEYECAVEFDYDIEGHACGGLAEDGHGWYVAKHMLELIEDESETTENQIDILFNDIMFK